MQFVFRRAALVIALAVPLLSPAQSAPQGAVFTILEENDLIVKTDRHYTQGIKLSFLQADNELPHWAGWVAAAVPALGFETNAVKFGYQIGQSMYTPANLAATNLLTNDRPYAGWLYTGLILQRRGVEGSVPVLENFQLDLGIIGPESLAKEAQTWVHELRGFALPRGWANQLKDEPGLDLKYERTWRISLRQQPGWGADFLPRAGLNLGNVETSARIGGSVRAGWHLPEDFGVQTIDSITTTEGGWTHENITGRLGLFAFAGVQGKAVGYETILDGNLYRNSYHVSKRPWVGEFYAGFEAIIWRVELGFTLVFRSEEFSSQTQHDGFGSAFLKAQF